MERSIQTGDAGEAAGLEPVVGKRRAGGASRSHVVVGSVLQAEELKSDGERVCSNEAVNPLELDLGTTVAAA